jgi:hypothetical protein
LIHRVRLREACIAAAQSGAGAPLNLHKGYPFDCTPADTRGVKNKASANFQYRARSPGNFTIFIRPPAEYPHEQRMNFRQGNTGVITGDGRPCAKAQSS